MRYHIHYGRLFPACQDGKEECLCYIKQPVYLQNKQICSADGKRELSIEIEETGNDARLPRHKFLMKDQDGTLLAEGQPGCASGSNLPPVPRGLRMDHVAITMFHVPQTSPPASYILQMQNSQNFLLTLPDGQTVMELIHNGVSGGWNVSTNDSFDAMLVMGIFLFCRYLDKENEFVIV